MPSETFGVLPPGTADLENDETPQAMWNTIENGGYDFMSKDNW